MRVLPAGLPVAGPLPYPSHQPHPTLPATPAGPPHRPPPALSTQVVWLLALQVPPYALTAQLVADTWAALDVGGSITIHAFGAVYGLAASALLSPKGAGAGHAKNGASYASDMTAMLGTLFLFIYW